MDEIIKTQTDALGINCFLETAKAYTENTFPDLDIIQLFSNSISGNIGNIFEYSNLDKIFSNEITAAVNLMISVLIIIISIVHIVKIIHISHGVHIPIWIWF